MEANEPVATPGSFFFFGDVTDEIKQATEQMQLGAEFSIHKGGLSLKARKRPSRKDVLEGVMT